MKLISVAVDPCQHRCSLSAIAPFEYRPCFVIVRRMRSMPAAVFAPVLSPPCNRHRPFGIAGHLHELPDLFFAPHRSAFEKSPEGLPFLNSPRRFSWGVCSA
jgi:hypothetical protein